MSETHYEFSLTMLCHLSGEILYRVTKESLMDRLNTDMHETSRRIDKDCRFGILDCFQLLKKDDIVIGFGFHEKNYVPYSICYLFATIVLLCYVLFTSCYIAKDIQTFAFHNQPSNLTHAYINLPYFKFLHFRIYPLRCFHTSI